MDRCSSGAPTRGCFTCLSSTRTRYTREEDEDEARRGRLPGLAEASWVGSRVTSAAEALRRPSEVQPAGATKSGRRVRRATADHADETGTHPGAGASRLRSGTAAPRLLSRPVWTSRPFLFPSSSGRHLSGQDTAPPNAAARPPAGSAPLNTLHGDGDQAGAHVPQTRRARKRMASERPNLRAAAPPAGSSASPRAAAGPAGAAASGLCSADTHTAEHTPPHTP